jgi:phosphomannomutase
MRQALEDVRNRKADLVEGVKIHTSANSWVLLTPAPDEALFHIWAEAEDKIIASELLEEYSAKIKEWQK